MHLLTPRLPAAAGSWPGQSQEWEQSAWALSQGGEAPNVFQKQGKGESRNKCHLGRDCEIHLQQTP